MELDQKRVGTKRRNGSQNIAAVLIIYVVSPTATRRHDADLGRAIGDPILVVFFYVMFRSSLHCDNSSGAGESNEIWNERTIDDEQEFCAVICGCVVSLLRFSRAFAQINEFYGISSGILIQTS